ncbi:putative zinc-binding metallopeptidase [Botrimarina sp.]|uniref:putative zinc-binding metallopeptidase n=1 Tax=Botrimarina sp. TaxID=2795802 RepID=UPI0032ED63CE
MLTYPCRCGATLFFENVRCLACGRDCGWCDACRRVVAVEPTDNGAWRCAGQGCGATLAFCKNRTQYDACNALVDSPGSFCRSCQATTLAPNLDDPELLGRWRAMETAKRRLLYGLDTLGIGWEASNPPLTFRFPADTADEHHTTGHQDGVVTINLKEADSVERERARQRFGEPHRTLIGHLRHEASHWLWQVFVQGQREGEFGFVFGDHNRPPYAEAMPRYYEQGPPDDWQERHISRYAASHPWEDFAETAAFYLDMRAVLETVAHQFGYHPPAGDDAGALLATYQQLGVGLNEVNRALGLTDALPEVVSKRVADKVAWVHELLSQNTPAWPNGAGTGRAPAPAAGPSRRGAAGPGR